MLGGPARAVNDPEFIRFIEVLCSGHEATAARLLDASPQLAGARCVGGATRQAAQDWWIDEIGHYLIRQAFVSMEF
jgi:hypothetical protein